MRLSEIRKHSSSLLSAAFIGFGGVFALAPSLVNNLGGVFLPDSREVRLLIRLLGMRDISLGLGLLANRNKEAALTWRRIMAFNTGTDVVLLSLFWPNTKIKTKVTLALIVSAITTVAALFA